MRLGAKEIRKFGRKIGGRKILHLSVGRDEQRETRMMSPVASWTAGASGARPRFPVPRSGTNAPGGHGWDRSAGGQSGVELRFPPQSKTVCSRRSPRCDRDGGGMEHVDTYVGWHGCPQRAAGRCGAGVFSSYGQGVWGSLGAWLMAIPLGSSGCSPVCIMSGMITRMRGVTRRTCRRCTRSSISGC